MSDLLERFCRYVRIDTQADENSETYPSTAKQKDLSKLLAGELRELGLTDARMSEWGVVLATVPATISHDAPTLAWVSHVDTSPEASGSDVKPQVHENYDGKDIVLPGDSSKVIRVADTDGLAQCKGKTIITTDGTTLLGADDKAGVAVIVETAAQLMADRSIPHGPIRICFTCDEEIGLGTPKIDLKELGACVAYTRTAVSISSRQAHSSGEWKLCIPVERFGVGRPISVRRDPSVPPRMDSKRGSIPHAFIACVAKATAREVKPDRLGAVGRGRPGAHRDGVTLA